MILKQCLQKLFFVLFFCQYSRAASGNIKKSDRLLPCHISASYLAAFTIHRSRILNNMARLDIFENSLVKVAYCFLYKWWRSSQTSDFRIYLKRLSANQYQKNNKTLIWTLLLLKPLDSNHRFISRPRLWQMEKLNRNDKNKCG